MLLGSASGGQGAAPPSQSGPGLFAVVPVFFLLWGLMFVCFGLFALATPLRLMRRARRILYVLTDQRCIVWRPGMFSGEKVRSFTRDAVLNLERNSDSRGRGDLVFEQVGDSQSKMMKRAYGFDQVNGFIAIENVRDVELLIRETLSPGGR